MSSSFPTLCTTFVCVCNVRPTSIPMFLYFTIIFTSLLIATLSDITPLAHQKARIFSDMIFRLDTLLYSCRYTCAIVLGEHTQAPFSEYESLRRRLSYEYSQHRGPQMLLIFQAPFISGLQFMSVLLCFRV